MATGFLVAFSGCTVMNAEISPNAWSFKKSEPDFVPPRQIVPVWSDTVLHQPGEPATRGFGGRIMFYGEDKHKAIRVDGTLIVYAWDDSKGSMQRTPDRKYVFPSDEFQTHYSQSRLGHSYSFWVPWDAAGGPLQHLTLISRFVSNDGTEITAAPAHVVLQGPGEMSPFQDEIARSKIKTGRLSNRNGGLGQDSAGGAIQQASWQRDESISSGQQSSPKSQYPGLLTSEIGLTSGFYHRNMRGRQAQDQAEPLYVKDADELLRPEPQPRNTDVKAAYDDAVTTQANSSGAYDEGSAADLNPPSTRLRPFESRVRTSRAARSAGDPLRKEPLRAEWLNGLPETPRSLPRAAE